MAAKTQKVEAQMAQQLYEAEQLPVAEAMESAQPTPAANASSSTDETEKNTTFAPAGGKKQAADAQTYRMVVEVYTNTVLTQAKLGHLAGVDGIEEHEATAKEHAKAWTATVAPKIIQTNQDIIDFGNKFNNFMDPLQDALKKILANQPVAGQDDATKEAAVKSARAAMQEGLSLLLKDVNSHKENTSKAIAALETFVNNVQQDETNFKTDYGKVQARYLGNDGELENLQDLIDADHKAMTKDTAVIAGGSTGAVVGLLVIASGVLLEFETAGTSTALIVGGVVVIVVSGAAIGIAAADYQKKAEELKKSVTKLAHLSTEITVATSLKQHLANLSSTGSAALGALSKMEAQWTTLASTMQGVYNNFDSVNLEYVVFIQGELHTGAQSWREMQQQALLIANQMVGNPTVAYRDVSDITDHPTLATARAAPLHPMMLYARKVGANAIAMSASNGGLVDAMSQLEGDIARLHVAVNSSDAPNLPLVQQIVSMVPSLVSQQQTLLTNLAATGKSFGGIGKLTSETDNEAIGRELQSFLAALKGDLDSAKDLTHTAGAIYDESAKVSSETLTTIHADKSVIASDDSRVKSLESDIEEAKKKIAEHQAIVDAASWISFPLHFIVKEVGSLIAREGSLMDQVHNKMDDLTHTKDDLAVHQRSLVWVTAVHKAISEVHASSLKVSTTMQTITATVMAALENKPTSGVFALGTLMTVAQDFADIQAATNEHRVKALPVAHAFLMSGPRVATSIPEVVPVGAARLQVVGVSLLPGGSDVLAGMADLVDSLCGHLWTGDGASRLVATQPLLTLSLLPTLGEAQAPAASHARGWATAVKSGIIDVIVGIEGMSNASNAMISMMLELIDTATNDTVLETQLMQGIVLLGGLLSTFTDALRDNARHTTSAVRQLIADDTVKFGSLSKQMVDTYTGPCGEIEELRATVDSSSTKISAMTKAVTTRATNQLVTLYKEGLILAAGLTLSTVGVPLGPIIGGVASKATVETATKVTIKVVNTVGGEIKSAGSKAALEAINGTDDEAIVEAIGEYGALLQQLETEKLQAAAFLVLERNVTELGISVNETFGVLQKLQTSVTSLNNELKVMKVMVADKGSATAVKDKLVAMQAGHSQVQQHAQAATKSIIFST